MRVLLIAAVLLVTLPVVAQEQRVSTVDCTRSKTLEALRRARKWLPANEEIGSAAIGHLPRTAAQRLREQADDLEYVDAVLKICRE